MPADEPTDEREPDVLDPYIDWALGPGRSYYFNPEQPSDWIPVLIMLNGIDAREFASGILFIDSEEDQKKWQHLVRVPSLYTESPAADFASPYCTAMVLEDFFSILKKNAKLRSLINDISLGLPLDQETFSPDAQSAPSRERQP